MRKRIFGCGAGLVSALLTLAIVGCNSTEEFKAPPTSNPVQGCCGKTSAPDENSAKAAGHGTTCTKPGKSRHKTTSCTKPDKTTATSSGCSGKSTAKNSTTGTDPLVDEYTKQGIPVGICPDTRPFLEKETQPGKGPKDRTLFFGKGQKATTSTCKTDCKCSPDCKCGNDCKCAGQGRCNSGCKCSDAGGAK